MANATSELIWIQSLLKELHVPLSGIPILWCDNISAIALSTKLVLYSRTKHVELNVYYVREKVLSKVLFVQHVPSWDQVADVLTKHLSTLLFQRYRIKLRVELLPMLCLQGKLMIIIKIQQLNAHMREYDASSYKLLQFSHFLN